MNRFGWIKMKILITGANGFIAHNLVNYFIERGYDVWGIVRYGSSNVNPKCNTVRLDLLSGLSDYPSFPKFDYIVHTAAKTYVDNSLEDCVPFVENNLLGTAYFFEWIKTEQPQARVCLFSSDEVLGPAKIGEYFKEDAPFRPSNPYAATKAGQEMLAYSFAHSFGLDIFTVRCMNVYGPGEADYKFIGKTIKSINEGKKIILHGVDKNDVASRHWVHAKDVARALTLLMYKAKSKEIYHIAGNEMDVYTLAGHIFKKIKGKEMTDDDVTFVDFHKARKGHDKRYSLDCSKIKAMGWEPLVEIESGLNEII